MKYSDWRQLLTERFPVRDLATTERDWRRVSQGLPVDQPVTGVVVAKAHFGAWLDIGVGFPALLEIICISGLTPEKYHADDWCPIGSVVTAFVGGFSNHQVYVWQVRPQGEDNSDRVFVGGNRNPMKYGLSLRASSGDGPDPAMLTMAAGLLGRPVFFIDSSDFECEIIAATVHQDGQRIVYVESRAKDRGHWVDITIKIHFVDSFGVTSSVDIESYNPFFGCDVRFLDWVDDDVALLIYEEKHWTFAYRIGDKWPPQFKKIEYRWQIKDCVLSYMKYNSNVVQRIRIPSLESMSDVPVEEADQEGTLPPDPAGR